MKVKVIFPGKVKVSFRRGYLRQDPSVEAKRIKDHPDLQDKSAAQNEDRVKDNARSVVFMRGGDISDKQEVLGEYVLQFGKYKGKLFRWLAENDVGYVIYLIKKVREEERAGQFKPDGPKKDSLLSLLQYSYQEIKDLLLYLDSQVVTPPAKDDEDNLVGFGVHMKKTRRDVWKRRDDGFSAFILRQQYLSRRELTCFLTRPVTIATPDYLKRQSASEGRASSEHATSASHCPAFTEMEDDDELERMMLSISPSKLQVPPELLALGLPSSKTTTSAPDTMLCQSLLLVRSVCSTPARSTAPAVATAPSTSYPPPAAPSAPCSPDPPLPRYDQDVIRWNCSHHQRIWMKTEMEALGLWPGSRPVRHLMNMISLWRYPPQPELIDSVYELPSPNYFQLHPFFRWKPEHTIMERVQLHSALSLWLWKSFHSVIRSCHPVSLSA
ncbi:unnamed protein product [Boreogadus saida]